MDFCGTNKFYSIPKGVFTLIALTLKGSQIFNLIEEMRNNFWDILLIHEEADKQHYLYTHRLLRQKFKVYSKFLILDLFFYLYGDPIRKLKLNECTFGNNFYYPKTIPPLFMILLHTLTLELLMLSVVIVDVFIFTIATLTELQFQMINNKINKIFLVKYDGDADEMIRERLRNCNEHLSFLFRFRDIINKTFSPFLLIYVGMDVLSLCMSLYAVSNNASTRDILRGFTEEMCFFFQLMLSYCNPVENLVSEADKTADMLYLSEWCDAPKHYRDIAILLGKSQQRMFYSAGGILDVNHRTSMKAIKTVLSYWAFLRAVGNQ